MHDAELNAFEEYFYRDLEKGFGADIACCDSCHDEFLQTWPYAAHADSCQFHQGGIDLDTFYSGSYLRDEYSKTDFDRLICKLNCPRCGNPLVGCIWAYNFPFDVPDAIERTIREIGEVARTTPFLLLQHDFCKQILASVRALAATLPRHRLNHPVYRARSEVNGPIEAGIEAFDFPPARSVQEGRFNHAGHPVLYLGSDVETCHAELRNSPCLVLEFELLEELRILDLIDPYTLDSSSFADADLLNCLVYSSLVSARQENAGWHRPHYVVSRFIADCARTSGIDAIRYPSTRRSAGNFNLAIVNSELRLASSSKVIAFHRRGDAPR